MAVFTAIASAGLAAIGITSTFIIGATADETLIEYNPDDKCDHPRADDSEDHSA